MHISRRKQENAVAGGREDKAEGVTVFTGASGAPRRCQPAGHCRATKTSLERVHERSCPQ